MTLIKSALSKNFISFSTFWMLCIFQYATFAQPSSIVRNYTVADGLSSQTVYAAMQDKEGYMWFATDAGACRFDGQTFTHYSIDEGLCDNEVLNITEDSKGRIWFLTLSGCLSFFFEGRIHNSETDAGLNVVTTNSSTYRLFEASDKTLYLSGMGGEVIKITPDLHCEILTTNQEYFGVHLLVYESKEGEIKIKKIGFDGLDNSGMPVKILTLISNTNDRTIAIIENGIGHFEDDRYQPLIYTEKKIENAFSARAYLDKNNNIWLTKAGEGVQYFEYDGAQYKTPVTILNGYPVCNLLVDADGNEWYCSLGRGVVRIAAAQRDILNYKIKTNDQTMCLYKDVDGSVWSGTSSGFLCQFKGREMTNQFQIVTGKKTVRFTEILIDSLNHHLWCAGDFGLLRFIKETDGWNPLPESMISDDIKSLSIAAKDRIVVSRYDGLSDVFIANKIPIIKKDHLIPRKRIYATHTDNSGQLWFENVNLLYCRVNGTVKNYPELTAQFGNKITSINETPDGALVVTTNGGGIHFLKNEKIVYSLSTKNGLQSNACQGVYIMGDHHYLATDNGLQVYTWDGHEAKIESQITQRDGLPSQVIYDVLVADSLIYLATSEGLVILNKERKLKYSPPPPIHWKSFATLDSTYNFSNTIQLRHDQSYITIEYTAISFDRPEDIAYQYKLKEDDEQWIDTKNNTLEFPNFEHGEYNLQVRARKHDSDWSEPISISFDVLPPYWKTWWFRLLVLMTISAITIGIVQIFARRKYERQLAIIKQEQAVLHERNRISSEMHDDLGSELTNIMILSRIAQNTLNPQDDKANPLKKIDAAATDVISKMNEIIWALNPSNDSLEGLINFLQRQFNDFIEFNELEGQLALPEKIPTVALKVAFRRNVVLIVKEYLHNVKKHSGATDLESKIEIGSNVLHITIRENGKGYDEHSLKHKGNGLRNMKKRADDYGGMVEIISSIGNGSSLILKIPL